MDRNTVTGLLLIFAMIMIYFSFFGPQPEEGQENGQDSTQTEQVEPVQKIKVNNIESKFNFLFNSLVLLQLHVMVMSLVHLKYEQLDHFRLNFIHEFQSLERCYARTKTKGSGHRDTNCRQTCRYAAE